MQEVLVNRGFVAPLMNALPFAFGKPITIGKGRSGAQRKRGGRKINDVGERNDRA